MRKEGQSPTHGGRGFQDRSNPGATERGSSAEPSSSARAASGDGSLADARAARGERLAGELEGSLRIRFADGRSREIRFLRQELTAQEERDVLESAKGFKGLGIQPADLLLTEFTAELAVVELRREKDTTDASLLRALVRGSAVPDAIDAPSVRAGLKSGRWLWRLSRNRYCKDYLAECADALRLKDSRRRPPRSPAEMVLLWGYSETYLNLLKEFAARTGTNQPRGPANRPPFVQVMRLGGQHLDNESTHALRQLRCGHLPLEGEDLEPAISRQIREFVKSKNLKGRRPPSQRAKLALLELIRKKPVTDRDITEAERLVKDMQKAVRDEEKRSSSAKLKKT